MTYKSNEVVIAAIVLVVAIYLFSGCEELKCIPTQCHKLKF